MNNRPSLLEPETARFPGPIDWTLLPPDRGFWTDHEMEKLTRLGSLMLIKNLQRRGLLSASKYKDAGKWHRAWTLNDLIVISLTQEVARHSGLSIMDTVDILSLIPADMHRSNLSAESVIDELLDIYAEWVSPQGAVGEAEEKLWTVNQVDRFSLVLIDRLELIARVRGTEGESRHIGRLTKDNWSEIRDDARLSPDQIKERISAAESILELRLSRMGLSPLRSEFQLEIDIEFVQPS